MSASKIKPISNLADKRVLLVDDNPSDRLILKAILSKLGIKNVQEAESVNTAIYKMENAADTRKAFNLVISDWNMPSKSGYDLLKFIRNEKRLKETAVIMMTATADSDRLSEAIALGIQDFVVKPVQHEILALKIEKLLSTSKL